MRTHVHTLAGMIGERNVARRRALDAARDYIDAEFRKGGAQVVLQTFEVDHVPCSNLEVVQMGTSRPEDILILGAHYDTIRGSPGANDNGSGVAALIELAAMFRRVEPALTVRFVAFVNEEPPFFWTDQQGSMVYAKAARSRGDRVRLMVSLETIGYYSEVPGSQKYPPLFRYFYPRQGNFLALISDLRSLPACRAMARAFRAGSDFPLEYAGLFRWIPGVSWSDHCPFWLQGYPAVMATDTAFHRYPYYHTAEDTPDKVHLGKLAAVTEALFYCCEALVRPGPHMLR